MIDLDILYEDNHLIAVNKPVGLLVQGDETGDRCLMDDIKEYLKERYQKPGNVFLGLLHRIDRPACGIVIFAKTSKGASRLTAQFRARTIKKVYYALVEGVPAKKSGTLIHYVLKDRERNVVTAFDKETGDAQYAELSYTVVDDVASRDEVRLVSTDGRPATLVRIELKTGRPHQIRVQFAAIGHSIVGDVKYGAHSKYAEGRGIALCAAELQFKTATGDREEHIKIEVPF